MYIARGLLIISFGSMLRLISCYSDGSLLELEPDQCQTMNIIHLDGSDTNIPAQVTEAPFKVEPESVKLNVSVSNIPITVTLSGGSSQFKGFMLDSRQCDNCPSEGTFSLEDLDNSQLICGGRVVVHVNNLLKNSIRVSWTPTPPASGIEPQEVFFRAAFIENYSKFWRRKSIDVLSTTTPTTETSAHTRLTTSPTESHATGTSTAPSISETNSVDLTTSITKFTTSNIVSQTTALCTGTYPAPLIPKAKIPSTLPCQRVLFLRCVLALLLFSRLCFLGGSSLLIIIRPVLKKTTTICASVLELASKTIAVILVLIIANKCAGFRFTALTVTALVSSLLHTITVLLACGPSHELRKCWLCATIIVDLINTAITTTAIFFGLWCFEESWLPILMGVYVVWEIILYLGSVCYEQMEKYQTRKRVRKNQNRISERRISPWLFMFIIFTIVNVSLTAALITAVSLVRMIN